MGHGRETGDAPILANKHPHVQSVFTPESLLREARRQKALAAAPVPDVCVLDPDGDIVRHLRASGAAAIDPCWACYHTELVRASLACGEVGIVGCAVGAPFAVLVAEQLFASGCRLLISITSAGQLIERRPPPYFILIERALRDEGTSYHYAAPTRYCAADPALIDGLPAALADNGIDVLAGASWTTDAPFRETGAAIDAMRAEGLEAVEMEAAALYAFARARQRPVVCFAHITNRMAQEGDDFEKGQAGGAHDALALIATAATRLLQVIACPR